MSADPIFSAEGHSFYYLYLFLFFILLYESLLLLQSDAAYAL